MVAMVKWWILYRCDVLISTKKTASSESLRDLMSPLALKSYTSSLEGGDGWVARWELIGAVATMGKSWWFMPKKWCYIRIKGRKYEMDGNWWLFSCKHVENAWKPPHCGWEGPNIDFEICHRRICQNIPECIEQLQHILMKDILAAHVAGATMMLWKLQFTRTDEHWPRREETWAQGFAGGLCCLILKDQRSRNKSKSMLWSKGLAPSDNVASCSKAQWFFAGNPGTDEKKTLRNEAGTCKRKWWYYGPIALDIYGLPTLKACTHVISRDDI